MATTKSTRPKGAAKAKAASATGAASKTATNGSDTLFLKVKSPTQVDFPLLEDEIQRWWDERDILNKYLHRNDESPRRYSFIDGPITANNPMGVHHAWSRTYKDVWQRFHTMQGFRQRYQNGFDCQGLWVEVEVEKELKFKNKREIEAYGVGEFVEKCKQRVLKYSGIQTAQSIRLGEWMDWDHSYYTMSDENNYTIWAFLKKCWESGWVYHGHDVMPWCPRCATGISDMEINEGRKEVQHTSVYVRFPLVDRPGEYLLVWTTTPWTLPANVAAAVNPELTYAKVEQDGEYYYLSQDVVAKLNKLRGHEHGAAKVVETLPGSDLLGWEYTGPFDELPAWQEKGTGAHHVVPADYVTAEDGTGIVHIAPGCGKEDFALGKAENLPTLAPVDDGGVYIEGYDWLTGMEVRDVAHPIFTNLRSKGLFYQTETIQHVYPHCWRCGTELIFRLVDEWFISMRDLRVRMMRFVPSIRWIPGFGLDREMDWLRNMEDWMISKKRYWGLALPIYHCAQCDHFEVIGSEVELQERAVKGWEQFEGHTPHRPYVDAVKINCSNCGALVSRIPDVGNPWLDAGIVPYSTLNYRNDREEWKKWFPAHFITESFPGQFRNWFFSMLVMSAALEDTEPYKTVLGFATVFDQRGKPMHKSAGNSIPFDEAAAVAGADTMRWMYTNQAPESNVNFPDLPKDEDVEAARAKGQPPRLNDLWMQIRSPLDKLWNVYSFFVSYANIDNFNPTTRKLPMSKRSDLDRWLNSELQALILRVTERLEDFDSEHATQAIADFIEDLSNWYLRRSRRRFWKGEEDNDKVAAYLTLYEALVTTTKLLAPFTPFFAEALWQNLARSVDPNAAESVHLADWPKANKRQINQKLVDETALVVRLVNLGRAAREQAQIRVRQPLGVLYVTTQTEAEAESLKRLGEQVLEELNVKRLEVLPRDSDMLAWALKPKRAALGPKYGKRQQAIVNAMQALDQQAGARELRETGTLRVEVEGETFSITADEVDVEARAREGFTAAEERGYVAALDTTLTPELVAEGLVRDLTHFIQDARKSAGLAIEDHIHLWLETDAAFAETLQRYAASLADETLADPLTINGKPAPQSASREEIPAAKLGDHAVVVALAKK